MLTEKLAREAFDTAFAQCEATEGPCIHSGAFDPIAEEVIKTIHYNARIGNHDPVDVAVVAGIHIGYRLRQLEEQRAITEAIEAHNAAGK